MNFLEIFTMWYTLYRGQAKIPAVGEREWNIAEQLANNAILKWDRADGTLWRELFTTNIAGGGDSVVAAGTTEYAAPDDMRKPGGLLRVGNRNIQIIEPQEAIKMSGQAPIAYFTGSANTGFTLNLINFDTVADQTFDYIYYRKPTLITSEDSVPDMSDPNFMIQDMLASRFINSRNSFGFQQASAAATNALANMRIENDSGTYGAEWSLTDDETPGFGQTGRWLDRLF